MVLSSVTQKKVAASIKRVNKPKTKNESKIKQKVKELADTEQVTDQLKQLKVGTKQQDEADQRMDCQKDDDSMICEAEDRCVRRTTGKRSSTESRRNKTPRDFSSQYQVNYRPLRFGLRQKLWEEGWRYRKQRKENGFTHFKLEWKPSLPPNSNDKNEKDLENRKRRRQDLDNAEHLLLPMTRLQQKHKKLKELYNNNKLFQTPGGYVTPSNELDDEDERYRNVNVAKSPTSRHHQSGLSPPSSALCHCESVVRAFEEVSKEYSVNKKNNFVSHIMLTPSTSTNRGFNRAWTGRCPKHQNKNCRTPDIKKIVAKSKSKTTTNEEKEEEKANSSFSD